MILTVAFEKKADNPKKKDQTILLRTLVFKKVPEKSQF